MNLKRLMGLPLVFIAAALAGLLTAVPSGYYILSPGGSYEVGPRLHLPEDRRQEMGRLAFTAVAAGPASWLELGWAKVSGTGELVPAAEFRPPDVSQQEMNEINRRLIEESKSVASVVALRAAGYDARVTGQGAEVAGLVEGSPAVGVLRPGDIIVGVDGQPTTTATEVVELVRRHAVGDQVGLTIVRDGQRQEVTVGTKSSPSEPGRPIVGVSIGTRLFDVALPFSVEIDTANVGGPSAGFMFALGIFDGVTAGDLTRGHFIAGTGTICADGTVGPIGGAAEKVVAAERDGAEVFLVPTENAVEARRRAHAIKVVPVDRFEQAVRLLCGLQPATGSPADAPAPCALPAFAG